MRLAHSAEQTKQPHQKPPHLTTADRSKLVRLAYRFLWNQADAEEVVQESLATAHERANELQDRGKWWNWICRIVIHACHTRSRAKKRWQAHEDGIARWNAKARVAEDVSAVSQATEFKRLIREAIPALPMRQQQVLVLRHLEEMSFAQIAELLEISESTARVHARDARENLRTMLLKRESD